METTWGKGMGGRGGGQPSWRVLLPGYFLTWRPPRSLSPYLSWPLIIYPLYRDIYHLSSIMTSYHLSPLSRYLSPVIYHDSYHMSSISRYLSPVIYHDLLSAIPSIAIYITCHLSWPLIIYPLYRDIYHLSSIMTSYHLSPLSRYLSPIIYHDLLSYVLYIAISITCHLSWPLIIYPLYHDIYHLSSIMTSYHLSPLSRYLSPVIYHDLLSSIPSIAIFITCHLSWPLIICPLYRNISSIMTSYHLSPLSRYLSPVIYHDLLSYVLSIAIYIIYHDLLSYIPSITITIITPNHMSSLSRYLSPVIYHDLLSSIPYIAISIIYHDLLSSIPYIAISITCHLSYDKRSW